MCYMCYTESGVAKRSSVMPIIFYWIEKYPLARGDTFNHIPAGGNDSISSPGGEDSISSPGKKNVSMFLKPQNRGYLGGYPQRKRLQQIRKPASTLSNHLFRITQVSTLCIDIVIQLDLHTRTYELTQQQHIVDVLWGVYFFC